MSFLALPAEVLEIIVDYLNPGPSGSGYYRAYAPTACLCKIDEIRVREQQTYLMSPESKRSILALASACKGLRMMIFDRRNRVSLDITARTKVQTLILKGNSIDNPNTRPSLVDYINLFSQLREIQIALYYRCMSGHQKPHKQHQAGTTLNRSNSKGASSKSVKIDLAIYQEMFFQGGTDEGFTRKSLKDFASSGYLQELNAVELDNYHLELTFSRSRSSRSGQTFWNEFTSRMQGACKVPAKNVSMCFLFQLNGESEQLLAALSTAIAQWPKEVECIFFSLDLDEFVLGGYKWQLKLTSMGKNGQVALVDGYLPSKQDLDHFILMIQGTRPNLRAFDLIIYTFHRYNHPLLSYHHVTTDCGAKQISEQPSSVIEIDVNELKHLYSDSIEQKRIYGSGSRLQEHRDDMDMRFEMEEEHEVEEYGSKYLYEIDDGENSDSSSEY
ncbi:hypothetical protein QFC22_006039 [Naganishia vaughanmartiniae]|uniref:Uncharacterized protein n=1 Tax=Naganishia vaughanmartiniae TaxID=1424756 RepID=A0ACC2WN65_9TREE|nr:hypothetical protein QFC22_006039 [Naganishia vaughanmartiniae]